MLCLVPPSAGASNTLLSGYAGPGVGNQAIIGSALVGGGGSTGSGGGASGGSGQAAGGSSSSAPAPVSPASIALPRGGAPAASGPRHATKTASTGTGSRGRGATPAKGASSSGQALPAARPAAHVAAAGTLGLSAADLLYILLALCVLALTGAATARLARRPDPVDGPERA